MSSGLSWPVTHAAGDSAFGDHARTIRPAATRRPRHQAGMTRRFTLAEGFLAGPLAMVTAHRSAADVLYTAKATPAHAAWGFGMALRLAGTRGLRRATPSTRHPRAAPGR